MEKIPNDFLPKPSAELRNELLQNYLELEFKASERDKLSKKEQKKLKAFRKAVVKEFPDEFIS